MPELQPRPAPDVAPSESPPVAADPRVLQANERTLLAWIRTAIALMAFGFVVARMGMWLRVSAGGDPGAFRASVFVGASLVALGTFANAYAAGRYLAVKRAILQGRPVPADSYGEIALATAIVIAGGFLTVYLFAR